MLDHEQFAINEAWVAFRLNDAPIATEEDGDFNALALMDVASFYIVGTMFVPSDKLGPTREQSIELLDQGESQKNELPRKLYVSDGIRAPTLLEEAEARGIEAATISEAEIEIHTGEAREGFREHFGGNDLH